MYNNTVSVDFDLLPPAPYMHNYALQSVNASNLTDGLVAFRLHDQEPDAAELRVCPAGLTVDLGSQLTWDGTVKYDWKIAPISYDGESNVWHLSVNCYAPTNYINAAVVRVNAYTSDCAGKHIASAVSIPCGPSTCADDKMCNAELACDLSRSPSSNSTHCYLMFDGLLKNLMKEACVTVKEGVDYTAESMPKLCNKPVFVNGAEVISTTNINNASIGSSVEGSDIVTTIVVPVVRNNSFEFVENVTRGFSVDPDSLEADFKNITDRLDGNSGKGDFPSWKLYAGIGAACAAVVGASVGALVCQAKKAGRCLFARKEADNGSTSTRSSLHSVEDGALSGSSLEVAFEPVGESNADPLGICNPAFYRQSCGSTAGVCRNSTAYVCPTAEMCSNPGAYIIQASASHIPVVSNEDLDKLFAFTNKENAVTLM